MKNRLSIAVSITALIIALLAATGTAEAVISFAANAGKLNGYKASKVKKKNTVVVRGRNGLIDRASIPPQARGARGATGATGQTGPPGQQGIQGPPGPPGAPNPNADTLNGYAANGLARVARVNAGQTVLGAADTTVATVSITAPAAGFVLVQADYNLTGTGCPCEGWFVIRDNVNGALNANYKILQKSAAGNYDSGSLGWVFPVTAGVRTFSLRGFRFLGTTATVDGPAMQALYVPFGSTGGSTLGSALVPAGNTDTAAG